MPDKKRYQTDVLIIGGGVTGTGLARDLALRGISSMVLEKDTINAGASGRNHGLLHSGARYVFSDPVSAMECKTEGDILKTIAPHCIEETGGLFIAVEGDDEAYIQNFPGLCQKAGIPLEPLDVKDALELEPGLSKRAIAAFRVEDASVEPYHISLENMNQAIESGARYFNFCQVVRLILSKNAIKKVVAKNLLTHQVFDIKAKVVVNAAGAWSGEIAKLAGIHVDMICSKGSLLITHSRMAGHVINRLRPPSDGDILVPGRTVSIFGTTSLRVKSPDKIRPTVEETGSLIQEASALVPEMAHTRYIRAYAGVRPLISNPEDRNPDGFSGDRSVSRGFSLIDHESDRIGNFITITGGKMTTFRLMAEKTADLVAQKLGVHAPCLTASTPLRSSAPTQMTEAGMAFHMFKKSHEPSDITLCECEMISKGQFKQLIDWLKTAKKTSDLKALRVHSRLGKGSCQGTFCSQRVTGFMYEEHYLKDNDGIYNIKDLLKERFIGQRPILWDGQLAQAELSEALFCGFFGLDVEKPLSGPKEK